jgi:N-acyl-D-amino-acid deacylase
MMIDWLFKGGMVIDGSDPASQPKRADVALRGDRIYTVGSGIDLKAGKTLDVTGMYVVPGFVDAHAHSEFTLLADGRAEGKIRQGVTTEINGNCGMSAAPLYGAALEKRKDELDALGIRERWRDFPEYFGILLKNGIALNFATLTGHGNLRAAVAGYRSGELSEPQLDGMLNKLRRAMASGAKGISTGLIYPPGVFAGTEEIICLAHEAKKRGGVYATHMRSEGDNLLESVDEVVRIARETGIHAHISHLKTSNKQNWEKIDRVIGKIEEARASGLDITCDRYPYTASSTDLDSILPLWAYEGGDAEELRRLSGMRAEIARSIQERFPDREDWRSVVIASVRSEANRWMEGRDILEIADEVHKPPADTVIDLLIDERLRVSAIFRVMNEENMIRILQRPFTMIGSDSSARSFDGITAGGKPHPRGFGSFVRVLGVFARDKGVMSIGEAVYKMTGLTAKAFGLRERGILREGFFADITVFDPEKVIDRATYAEPFALPDGIYHVFVNGRPVLLDQEPTGEMPGRVI